MGRLGSAVERSFAKIFGVKRRWDKQAEGGTDLKTDWLSIEIYTRDVPQYVRDELEQARRDNLHDESKKELLPISIQHEKHKNYDEAIVHIKLEDFRRWFLDE